MKTTQMLITTGCIFMFTIICSGKEAINIRKSVLNEFKKYPKLEIQDLYKLAYQAAMGNEHIMRDTALARSYLLKEIASIDTNSDQPSDQPLVEYLTSDSMVARVNLKVFKALKLDPETLLKVMFNSPKKYRPSIKLLRNFLHDIEKLAIEGSIPFNSRKVKDYFKKMERQNFPVVHHSKTVKDLYRPAYRIVAGKNLQFK